MRKNKGKGTDYLSLFLGNGKTDSEKIQSFGILLEDIDHKFDAVLEATLSTKDSLRQEIAEFREEVKDRFDVVETVVRKHSDQINGLKTEMQGVKSEVQCLKTEMQGLSCEVKKQGEAILRVEQKVDKIAVSVESHETRLTVVEEKIESHLAVHP